jgi:hypothetical protein
MTHPITLEEVREYISGFEALRDIDPRTGIKPEALIEGLSKTIFHSMKSVPAPMAATVVRAMQTETNRDVIIGYYSPKNEKDNRGFCYHRGWNPVRIGIRRFDEVENISPVDMFALQTGGSIEINPTLSMEVYKTITRRMLPYELLRVMERANRVTALRFTMPSTKTRKKRSKDAIYAERRANMISNLGSISWGARLHTRADFDFAEHFRKNQYHASLLKDEMGKYAAQELDRLEARYAEVAQEVATLVDAYRQEIADLERRLRLNQVP